ncbi:hypothetical protein JY97_13290 [Alkalispirochaeta odontotermitis]|nr:hypothetical protein JY97_13290 [Alkalispirochaeta odontotermitis]
MNSTARIFDLKVEFKFFDGFESVIYPCAKMTVFEWSLAQIPQLCINVIPSVFFNFLLTNQSLIDSLKPPSERRPPTMSVTLTKAKIIEDITETNGCTQKQAHETIEILLELVTPYLAVLNNAISSFDENQDVGYVFGSGAIYTGNICSWENQLVSCINDVSEAASLRLVIDS